MRRRKDFLEWKPKRKAAREGQVSIFWLQVIMLTVLPFDQGVWESILRNNLKWRKCCMLIIIALDKKIQK